jgi:hypothetical protein
MHLVGTYQWKAAPHLSKLFRAQVQVHGEFAMHTMWAGFTCQFRV